MIGMIGIGGKELRRDDKVLKAGRIGGIVSLFPVTPGLSCKDVVKRGAPVSLLHRCIL